MAKITDFCVVLKSFSIRIDEKRIESIGKEQEEEAYAVVKNLTEAIETVIRKPYKN